tara:strand:- start:132 stop:485 length:354 start_codon:yes stop_codon:yes gene_type:complete
MRTNVIAKLELEGLHNWPDAKKVFPEVAFLSDIHRHKWYITAKKKVNHDDRDIEFIMFKRDIEEYLRSKYYDKKYRSHYFGAMSCEMLAREILDLFDCCYVSVYEDNENGAEVMLGY